MAKTQLSVLDALVVREVVRQKMTPGFWLSQPEKAIYDEALRTLEFRLTEILSEFNPPTAG